MPELSLTPLRKLRRVRAVFSHCGLSGMHFVTGVAVVCDTAHDGYRQSRIVAVVCEAVPLSFGDKDQVALSQPNGLAVGQVETFTFKYLEVLLGVGMTVKLVPAVRRKLGNVEDGRFRLAVVAVSEPMDVHPFPAGPLRDRRIERRFPA